jgi:hypothetical protein
MTNTQIVSTAGVGTIAATSSCTSMSHRYQAIANIPFVDGFPDWSIFDELCKKYPVLKKSLENLKTCYAICTAETDI